MDVLSREATAYMRAADVAGVELPADIIEARKNLERIEAEIAAMPAGDKVPTAAALVATGTPLAKAEKEHARLKAEAEAQAETRRVAVQARRLARRTISRICAEHRDQLIHNLRPVVDDLIEAARPLAATLAPFAPKYDAGTVVRKADPEQVEAWREAEDLEREFGTCMAAWRASFKADMTRNSASGFPSPTCPPGFRVRSIREAHRYWENPAVVQNERLVGAFHWQAADTRDKISPTLLAVASEPAEAGFRLATVAELSALYDAKRAVSSAPRRR